MVGIVSRSVGAARASSRAPEGRGRGTARAPRPAAEPATGNTADELPRAIRRAAGLEGFQGEAVDLPSPARATAAARAFATGNGYLPGLIVDRLA
jgi:hypothetical protein